MSEQRMACLAGPQPLTQLSVVNLSHTPIRPTILIAIRVTVAATFNENHHFCNCSCPERADNTKIRDDIGASFVDIRSIQILIERI